MPNSYLETVILYCLQQINGDRSIYSIFHILKGKKSSQSIQDAHLFQLAPFFQSFDFIKREEFDLIITHLLSKKWVKQRIEQHYQLTEEGKETLERELRSKPFPIFINGLTYQAVTGPFWDRLSLLVQVSSNLVHNQSRYMPIQRKVEVQNWLKTFLAKFPHSRNDLARELHAELVSILDKDPSLNPAVLVIRFTGHNFIGLTPQQAAHTLHLEFSYYHLQFLNVLHYLVTTVEKNKSQYPLLYTMIKDLLHSFPFTYSTMKTYELLRSGVPLDHIAKIRRLKRSTIEDHLVEIAFNDPQFNISPFVSDERQALILAAAKQINSKQLKHLREMTNGIDYFEIRLVLAKYGERS